MNWLVLRSLYRKCNKYLCGELKLKISSELEEGAPPIEERLIVVVMVGIVVEGDERTDSVELEDTERRAEEAKGTRLFTFESTEGEGEAGDGGVEGGGGKKAVEEEREGDGEENDFSWLKDEGPTPSTSSTV